jgi:hypothetical protein
MVQMAEPSVGQEKSVLVAVSDVPESQPFALPQDSTLLRLAKLFLEEPDALIGHVRVCGGSGRVTARFYPAGPKRLRRHAAGRHAALTLCPW